MRPLAIGSTSIMELRPTIEDRIPRQRTGVRIIGTFNLELGHEGSKTDSDEVREMDSAAAATLQSAAQIGTGPHEECF